VTAAVVSPVLDAESATAAVAILVANPGSLVASRGPQWVLQDTARRLVADAAITFLVGDGDGVILADRMQTPGHLRLSLAAVDDAAITGETLGEALREAIGFLAASVDLVRVDLVFGVYNELLVGWALGADRMRFEGVLSDAFFAGGRYWDGLIVALTGAALEDFRDRTVPAREKRIADRLRARIRTDLEPDPVEAIA
jgi:hypothetical protein